MSTLNIIYETPEYKIGKTIWKMIVHEVDDALIMRRDANNNLEFTRGKDRYTDFLFEDRRELPFVFWKKAEFHPKYNHNDSFMGLPKKLTRIYEKHAKEIKEALNV